MISLFVVRFLYRALLFLWVFVLFQSIKLLTSLLSGGGYIL